MSWSAGGSCVPPVEGPGLPDEATHGDDRVGEVEEGVDHVFLAFVAALQPVERVVPGIRALDMPALGGLDGGFDAFTDPDGLFGGVPFRCLVRRVM